jgi:hypothetical protein
VRAGKITDAVQAQLHRQHGGRATTYRREWSIAVGASRVDLAAINGRISGFEIKSAQDNLDRLVSQAAYYSAVLDRAVLVVEDEHVVRKAVALVPSWWGVWSADETERGVRLNVVRAAVTNPAPDPYAIAQLLWRDEAYAVLERRRMHDGLRRATRWRLWNRLVELPLPTLRREVRETIKARPGW